MKPYAVALNPKLEMVFSRQGHTTIVRLAEYSNDAQLKLCDMVCGATFQSSPFHRLAGGAFAELFCCYAFHAPQCAHPEIPAFLVYLRHQLSLPLYQLSSWPFGRLML